MIIDTNIYPYFNGEQFSSGLPMKISAPEKSIKHRIELIEEKVRNKNIVHLGCADHINLIQTKIEKNIWLHKRLTDVSDKCLGIDINDKAIKYIKDELNYKNIICADITQPIPEILSGDWDYIVLGEILEHIDDPVAFLKKINNEYNKNIRKLIITVPNAFCWNNFKNLHKHKELINTDHRYWFTPFTLGKVAHLAGMKLLEIDFCESYKWSTLWTTANFYHYLKLKKYPALRSTIVAVCELGTK